MLVTILVKKTVARIMLWSQSAHRMNLAWKDQPHIFPQDRLSPLEMALASRLGVNPTTQRRIIAGEAFAKNVRGKKKLPLTPQRANAIRACLQKTLPEAVQIYRLAELTLNDLKIDFGYYNSGFLLPKVRGDLAISVPLGWDTHTHNPAATIFKIMVA